MSEESSPSFVEKDTQEFHVVDEEAETPDLVVNLKLSLC